MSEVKVNKLSPRSGTTVTLGDSGDTITIPSGVTFDASSGGLAGTLTTAAQPNITSVGTLTSFTSTGIDDNATSTTITITSGQDVQIGSTNSGLGGTIDLSIGNLSSSGGITLWSPTNGTHSIGFGDGFSGTDRYRGYLEYDHAGDSMRFATSSTERMRIDSSGRVIIGGTTPDTSAKLTLEGGDLRFNTDDKGILWGNNEIKGNNASDFINIVTAGTERMRISSGGNVGMGNQTTPFSTDATLNVDQIGSGFPILCHRDGTGDGVQISFRNDNGQVGRINTSGSATSYVTSSDYRLKENVNYDFDATTRLKQLKPARFNFIADADKTVDGFLAHEVQDIVPEAITGTKDAVQVWEEGDELPEGVSVGDNKLDENGNTIPEYQGIDQSKLVPLLVKTIQELEARITQLENN